MAYRYQFIKAKEYGVKEILSGTKGFLVLLMLCLVTVVSYGQEVQQKVIPQKKSKSYSKGFESEAALLIYKAESIMGKNPSGAIEAIESALTESIKSGDKTDEANCYRVLGLINLNSNLNELALKNTTKAFQLFSELKNEYSLSVVRIQVGDCYAKTGSNDRALKLYKEQLEVYKNYINDITALSLRYKIAELYEKQNENTQALSSYKAILAIEQKNKNEEGIVLCNTKIGALYEKQSNNEKALDYYNRAQTIVESSKNSINPGNVNENISSLLKKEKKYDEEIELRKRGLEINMEKQDVTNTTIDNLAIGKSYVETNRPDEAIPFLKKSIQLSDKTGQLEQKAEAYKVLSDAYTKKNQYGSALRNFQVYVTLKDSILKIKETSLDSTVSGNLNLTEKQQRIEWLERDIELNEKKIEALTSEQTAKEERLGRQRVIIYSLIFGILLIVVASYLLYKNTQKRRIANQLLALKSLRSQMNPHFIFNALNSVNSFISKNDEKSANKYLSDFSRLMRMVMENSQEDFVSLSAEIQILELYIGLEHFRFKEKFTYTFEVDSEIDKDAFEIPPMLIQPYIENAVWHGLRYKETMGRLHIAIKKDGENKINVLIEDDGVGRKRSAELKTLNQKAGSSTGIKNTVNRIAIINELYHKEIEIKIEDLDVTQLDTGTRVQIILPGKIAKQL